MSEPAVSEGGGAYKRGVVAGEISARLAGHDKHFASINGSLIDVAAEMKAMNLQLQRMADAMQADRERAIATAEALEKADAARRVAAADTAAAGERRWTPLARLGVFTGIAAAIATIAVILANVIHQTRLLAAAHRCQRVVEAEQ